MMSNHTYLMVVLLLFNGSSYVDLLDGRLSLHNLLPILEVRRSARGTSAAAVPVAFSGMYARSLSHTHFDALPDASPTRRTSRFSARTYSTCILTLHVIMIGEYAMDSEI